MQIIFRVFRIFFCPERYRWRSEEWRVDRCRTLPWSRLIGVEFRVGQEITLTESRRRVLRPPRLHRPWIRMGAFLFSVVLGVIFGMYPAIKASGLQPVVALRAE